MSDTHIVNSHHTLREFVRMVIALWDEAKYLRIEIKVGPIRKLSQNALYHIWSRQYAAHVLGIKPNKAGKYKVTKAQHEAMKYTLQRHCYVATAWDFLVISHPDMLTGDIGKPERRSSADFLTGEMYQYMEWIQARAADEGLILESLGEYKTLKEQEAA